jgi:hypothetical protein
MAVIALNKFRTIRYKITSQPVEVYTCPIGVASIITLCQVTNVADDGNTYSVTGIHTRGTEGQFDTRGPGGQFKFANLQSVPTNDSVNLLPDGKLALETYDALVIQGSADNKMHLILSVLETAKQ